MAPSRDFERSSGAAGYLVVVCELVAPRHDGLLRLRRGHVDHIQGDQAGRTARLVEARVEYGHLEAALHAHAPGVGGRQPDGDVRKSGATLGRGYGRAAVVRHIGLGFVRGGRILLPGDSFARVQPLVERLPRLVKGFAKLVELPRLH